MANQNDLHADLNNGKVVELAEQVLYPVIERQIDNEIALMCAEFTNGKLDQVHRIAKIASLRDIVAELETIKRKGHRAAEKLQKVIDL